MAFSKKKPYYYLKDSHLTFMQRRDRWLRDLYTKESLFEKPYFSERAEMHMEMPSFVLPQFPPYPEYGPLPPINYPPPYDRYVPRTPTRFPRDPTPDERRTSLSGRTPKKSTELLSGGVKDQGASGMLGFNLDPYCFIWEYPPECLDEGQIAKVRVRINMYSGGEVGGAQWRAVAQGDRLSANLVSSWGSEATFVIQASSVEGEESVGTVCFYVKFGGQEKETRCGCVEIRVPCECGGDETPVAWDYGSSDATIVRNGTATVVVTPGTGPYTWAVSGTGFSIPATTSGPTNTLSADGTACGSATITVTDACENVATGYVREEDNSRWQEQGGEADQCKLLGGTGSWYQSGASPTRRRVDVIQGNRKMHVLVNTQASSSRECPDAVTCENASYGSGYTKCSEYCEFRFPGYGCVECATGYDPPGWSVLGPWNCLGADVADCGDGTWLHSHCAFTESIDNYLWVCN